ncbi:MAG: DUF2892 domain-containing protein [Alphaproteobacteria bacterium]|nr:DUF2892 domain-containing protein [Alphaproteobacteria bacterium]
MFYRKNIRGWEQVVRIMMGIALIAYGLVAMAGTPAGYGLAAMGLMLGLTGVFGFCPACAMVGRKLDHTP